MIVLDSTYDQWNRWGIALDTILVSIRSFAPKIDIDITNDKVTQTFWVFFILILHYTTIK
jgi:hypothetical protein